MSSYVATLQRIWVAKLAKMRNELMDQNNDDRDVKSDREPPQTPSTTQEQKQNDGAQKPLINDLASI